ANVQSGHPPYRGAVIRSRGELLWILGAHDSAVRGTASGSEVQILGEESIPIDLQGADLRGVVLPGVDLREANLGGASFRDATLVGANLRGASLIGTDFRRANLCGADLSDSVMDASTDLKRVQLDSRTLLGDIKWNGVSLTRVDWSTVPRLGDELDIAAAKTRRQAISATRYAARSYRDLALS